MDEHRGLRIGVLGPLSLHVDGREVLVPGTKRRAVLAMLALASPDPVSADRLIDALWPLDPPGSGRAALQSHVSRLRRHLGRFADRLSAAGVGYRLQLDADELDARRFDVLVRAARADAERDPAAACTALDAACRIWRGPPLEELSDVEVLAAQTRALTEAWLAASELLAHCALRCGDPATALAAAAAAAAAEPLREAAVLLMMQALAAQHRPAEALRVGQHHRQRLREETGLDPSPRLSELEGRIAGGSPPAGEQPPPRVHRSHPPVPLGALLGREAELSGVERLLRSDRLVTIVGPGGVGKTRLAVEVAHRSATTQVTFVALAAVTDPTAVADVLARALGLEAGAGDPLERCLGWLRRRTHLLVLDNCEHLAGAVRDLAVTLLEACPELRILATSRQRLAVGAEQTCRLAPLPMPAAGHGDQVRDVPSVALFLDRARRVRPSFRPDDAEMQAVVRVVQVLDGLPLAIELAAGRLSSLGIADLESRLDRALDLLGADGTTDVDPQGRHRTLRAAVQWSYDLLPGDEQALFRHLAVFPGGFDLATAEMVARDLGTPTDPARTLARLVDSSMLVADLDGPPRYRMLDTLRTFGLGQLDSRGERPAADGRLARWAVELVRELDAAYESADEPLADQRLRTELFNLRAAWRLARDRGDLDVAASLVVDLYSQASWRELTELFRWSLELAADPALSGHPREAQVLGVASEAQWSSTGDLGAAEALARRAVAAVQPDDSQGFGLATWALADVLLFRGEYEKAGELAVAARQDSRWEAEGYAQAALAAAYAGGLRRAATMLQAAEARVQGPTLGAYLRYVAGEIANLAGDHALAKAAYGEAITAAEGVGASFIVGIASVGLVSVQAADGEVAGALDGYLDLVSLWERTGAWTQQWTTLRNLADLLERLGDREAAAALRAGADAAPEAAAVGGARPDRSVTAAGPDREQALALARDAVARAKDRCLPAAAG